MRAILTVAVLALLSGCATCERHPIACRTAVVVIAGGIVYAASTHHTQRANQCANIGLEC
jgi:uncharacterized protein YceK